MKKSPNSLNVLLGVVPCPFPDVVVELRVQWFPEGACGPGAAHGADLRVVRRAEAPKGQELPREHDGHRDVPRHGAGGEGEVVGLLMRWWEEKANR